MAVTNLGENVNALAAGEHHTCALLDTGSVRCWGIGSFGRLGVPDIYENIGDDEAPQSHPLVNLGLPALAIAAGGEHSCAILEDRTVRCWGRGVFGQLGTLSSEEIGDDEDPADWPVVDVGVPVVSLALGDHYSCAVTDTGRALCWGLGDLGRLGYGNQSEIGDNEAPSTAGSVPIVP